MERPERNQDAEPEEQQRENEILRFERKPMLGRAQVFCQFRNIESIGAGLNVKRDKAQQSDECADAQVERNLERGIVLLLAASPDADHDERRHQRKFVEKIKEKQIE